MWTESWLNIGQISFFSQLLFALFPSWNFWFVKVDHVSKKEHANDTMSGQQKDKLAFKKNVQVLLYVIGQITIYFYVNHRMKCLEFNLIIQSIYSSVHPMNPIWQSKSPQPNIRNEFYGRLILRRSDIANQHVVYFSVKGY